jgi:hypothetical protein
MPRGGRGGEPTTKGRLINNGSTVTDTTVDVPLQEASYHPEDGGDMFLQNVGSN